VPKRQCSERNAQRYRAVGSRGLHNSGVSSEGQPRRTAQPRNKNRSTRATQATKARGTPKYSPYYFRLGTDATTRQDTPPPVLVLSREGKWPSDWAITRTTDSPIEGIRIGKTDRGMENREKHVPTGKHTTCRKRSPNRWGPVTLQKRVGKGVFLTDQQPPRKIHVSCLIHSTSTNCPLPDTATNQ